MTPIQSKISEERVKGKRPPWLILHKDEWLTFADLARHPDFKDNDLNYDVLMSRYKNPTVTTMEDLIRKKRINRRKELSGEQNKFIIYDHGRHSDKKDAEVFAGYLSETQFVKSQTSNYWALHRLGSGRTLCGFFKGKRPYFINKNEAIEKGWKIRLFI